MAFTPGGASSPYWGGTIRLYVWAAIRAGRNMKWGPAAPDSVLDAGNVWAGGTVTPTPPAGTIWIDLSCDVLQVDTHIGGTRADGAMARAEAATATVTLVDPDRDYDPLNPDSPYQYGGQTRLMPGAKLVVWAEVDPVTTVRYDIFTGTVDSWTEEWQLQANDRRAVIVASDAVKDLVNLDYGEQPPVGAGDTVSQRIDRILTYYGWPGARNLDSSAVTLQATTLAQSAWELIGRASDDELGFTWIDAKGTLQFRNRDTWSARPAPVLTVGCSPVVTGEYDVMTEADVQAANVNINNAVYAARTGGTQQVVRQQASIDRYGLHSYKRTDLGLQTDPQVAQWAQKVVDVQGFPRAAIDSVTLFPRFDGTIWATLLNLKLITDRVRVLWSPPDGTGAVDAIGRAVGVDHSITRQQWETTVALATVDIFGHVLHWGPHADDRLSAGLSWT